MIVVLKRLVRDPLVHFIAAGVLLFAVYQLVADPSAAGPNGNTIVVDRAALLRFMQYQSAAFEPKYFSEKLDAMSAREKRDLIDRYVREEALYREASAMGLTDGDYVIRRRIVQKMLFLIDDTASEFFDPDEAALNRYFQEHRDRYRVAPSLTFTHVFVDKELDRNESAERTAERLKAQLQTQSARFEDAPRYGDRFPYLQNYVGRTPEYIEGQLGAAFTSALMSLEPSADRWQGPIESPLGYHVVMLTQHKAGYLPALDEVREQVKDDLLRDTREKYEQRAIADLVQRFDIRLEGLSIGASEQASADQKHLASTAR
jgi:hypothetical protein